MATTNQRIIANLLYQLDALKLENRQLREEDGDCCPTGSLPQLISGESYSECGTEATLDGELPIYSVGDPSTGRAVIVVYDIFMKILRIYQ